MAVVLLVGRLAGLRREELTVASSANVGGPATAAALAESKRHEGLVRPAFLVGTFGNAAGTAIGLATYRLLMLL